MLKINKETQEKVLKLLGVPEDQISGYLKDADIEIDLPAGTHIMTDADLADIKTNVRNETKGAAVEIGIKEIKKLSGVDYDGKDPQKLLESIKAAALKEANINPDARVTELTKDKEKLQAKLDEKDTEITGFKNEIAAGKLNAEYESYLHADRNPALTKEEWVNRLKNKYEFAEVDGKPVIKDKATGEVIKDKKENPRTRQEVIAETFSKTDGWLKAADPAPTPAGRKGASSNTGKQGKFTNLKEINEYCEANNISPYSRQAQAIIRQARIDNPQFDASVAAE